MRAAATGKARFPTVDSRVRPTISDEDEPAVWGFVSLGSTHCDRVSLLVVHVLQYFDAVGSVF